VESGSSGQEEYMDVSKNWYTNSSSNPFADMMEIPAIWYVTPVDESRIFYLYVQNTDVSQEVLSFETK
jgi:hypothetical protein